MAQTQFRSDDTDPWGYKYGAGSDGAYAPSTGTDTVIDSACSGTSGTTSLTATNAGFAAGQLILIFQTQGTGVGNWELNKISSYVAGTITTTKVLKNTYSTGAQVLVMPQYSSGSIAGGVTITGKAWNGTVGGIYAKFCTGTFTIAGNLVGTGVGFRGGNGTTSASTNGNYGESWTSVQGNSGNVNSLATGGGGGRRNDPNNDNSSGGGGGGLSTAGGTGTRPGDLAATGGAGGGTNGNPTGVFIIFGGGGGGAGGASTQPTNPGGNGGASGGWVFIIAPIINISGSIPCNGQVGYNGNSLGGVITNGGGGGSAGNILLKGQVITLGTGLVTATGAAGGGGNGGSGGLGGNGYIHADYSTSISGTTSPTIDSRQDLTLASAAGFFPFFM